MNWRTLTRWLLGTAAAGGLFLAYERYLGPVYECPECSPFSRTVVESLRERPEEWREDPYYLSHRKWELSFWIANGASFMSFYPHAGNPDEWDRGPCCASKEQRYVWTAYREWHERISRPLTLSKFRLREKEE